MPTPNPPRPQGLFSYGRTANEETRNSEFESSSFSNVKGGFLSVPHNFLVQRFHGFESTFLSKEYLSVELCRTISFEHFHPEKQAATQDLELDKPQLWEASLPLQNLAL